MLLDFEFSNFKSFKNTQRLSMRQRTNITTENLISDTAFNDAVYVAAIYGANAAGKTGVLEALDALREKATTTERKEDGDVKYGRKYKFADENSDPIEFKLVFIAGKERRRYSYEVRYNDDYIEYESLLVYLSSRPTAVFERQYNKKKQGGELMKLDKDFPRDQRNAIPNFLKNKVTLSLLGFLHDTKEASNEHISIVYDYFMNKIFMRTASEASSSIEGIPSVLNKYQDARSWLNMILPAADFGIMQVDTKEVDADNRFLSAEQQSIMVEALKSVIRLEKPDITDGELDERLGVVSKKELKLFFGHLVNNVYTDFDIEQESRGTLSATALFAQLIPILAMGMVFVVDELECSLHPMLVSQIVNIFNNLELNPHGAQLIFTTHDISLLDKTIYGKEILGRDEVWFVEKGQDGVSELYPLTDIKKTTRKDDNLYRKYVEGRYGAVPRVSIASRVGAYWMEHDDVDA